MANISGFYYLFLWPFSLELSDNFPGSIYAVQYLTSFNGNSVSKKFVLQSRSISEDFFGLYTAVSQGILLSTKFMQSHHVDYYPL